MASRIAGAVLWSMAASVCAAGVIDAERKVDAIFAPMAGGKLPGAAVAVVVDGRPVLMKGYGLADVNRRTAIAPSTIFRIASVTKTFTATAVLQLADAGKLSLDDPVSKYVPGMSNAAVRVKHLLSHTGGIGDFLSFEESLRRPLEFEPGSRINYSNSGYQLLGRVVEKASGQPWDEYLRDHVLARGGMQSTGYDRGASLPNRATGHLLDKDGAYAPITEADARDAYAAGGMYSTVEDMVRYAQALAAGKLLKRETLDRAWTPATLSDGRIAPYGLGWMIAKYRGVREIGHGGDITGFNSYVAIYPDDKLMVVVLSNVGMRPPGPVPTAGDLAHRVAELWLGDRLEQPDATVVVPAGTLESYVGRYRVEAPEEVLRNLGREIVVRREGDRLIAEANGAKATLAAKSETVFQAAGSPVTLTFLRGAGGQCPAVLVSLMGLREFRAARVESDIE